MIADEHGKELFRYGCNPAKTDQQPRQDERRSGTITTEQLAELNQLFTPARIAGMCSFYRVSRAEELSQGQASVIIAKRRREIERESKQ